MNKKQEGEPMAGESQIRELDRDVVSLKVGVAQLGVTANNLSSQLSTMQVTVTDLAIKMAQLNNFASNVEELQATVNRLNSALERARGAVWAFTAAATLVGAVIGMAVNAFFRLIGKD
jgi:outer membrane murein-binding lipoprotein Lpp